MFIISIEKDWRMNNLRKQAWPLSITLILVLFLSACGGNNTATDDSKKPNDARKQKEPVDGGDLIVGSSGSPTLFNPLYSEDRVSADIEDFIYDTLITSDLEFNTVNEAMAESVEESEDGLTYVVKLRAGIQFHDGEPLTADDVVFTYNIPLHKDYDGPRKSNFEALESVEKIDELTVQFNLNKVDANSHLLGWDPLAFYLNIFLGMCQFLISVNMSSIRKSRSALGLLNSLNGKTVNM